MPTISNLTFSIASSNAASIDLDVSYTVQQTALERFLGDAGLGFEECIRIVGGAGSDEQVLHTLPSDLVIFDLGELVASRSHRVTVPQVPHPDRLSARVEIGYVGLDVTPARAASGIRTSTGVRGPTVPTAADGLVAMPRGTG